MASDLIRLNLPRPTLPAPVAPVSEVRALTNPTTGWAIVRGDAPTVFQGTGREVRILGWERHPVVQACARLVADTLAAVPLEVYRKGGADGEDVTVLADHPLAQLLTAPRVAMSPYRHRALTTTHFTTYGNGFWVLERGGRIGGAGKITGLRLVHPEDVRYVYLDPDTTEILWYEWRDRNGAVHRSHVADVVHFRDHAGADWLFGYPRAAAALLDIHADHEASQYVRQVVTNDGTPGLIIQLNEMVSPTDAKAAEERWREKMAVRGNRGMAAFMPKVQAVTQLGFNLQQLEFPDLRRITREDICTAFGVDPRMIGISSAANDAGLSGEQYVEARERLIQHTVKPIMTSLEEELNLWLAPEYGDVYVRFSPEALAALTENITKTSERVVKEVQAGLRTVEEGRQAVGLDTDLAPTHHLAPTGTVKLRTVARALEDADAETPDPVETAAAVAAAKAGPPQNGGGKDEGTEDKAPTRAAVVDVVDVVTADAAGDAVVTIRAETPALPPHVRLALWRAFDAKAEAQEGPYYSTARYLFAREAESISALCAQLGGHRAERADDDPYFRALLERIGANYAAGGLYYQQWLEEYRRLMAATVQVGGADLAASVGLDFDLANPDVQTAIQQRAAQLADLVGTETAKQITAAVSVGREQGMGVAQIADLIRETAFSEAMTHERATRIARTETVGALNAGEYLSAAASGVFRSKEWLTQGDEEVRDSHRAQNGAVIPLADRFANGCLYPGDREGGAGEVINCRCTLLFHDTEAPK